MRSLRWVGTTKNPKEKGQLESARVASETQMSARLGEVEREITEALTRGRFINVEQRHVRDNDIFLVGTMSTISRQTSPFRPQKSTRPGPKERHTASTFRVLPLEVFLRT